MSQKPEGLQVSASILKFTQELVNIPAQGGIDSPQPMLDAVASWLGNENLPYSILLNQHKQQQAIVCQIEGEHPGPTLCFDACLDTAPVDDPASWKFPPHQATVADGWLYGRGCADSKVAVALFCHMAKHFSADRSKLSGRLIFLFDADEHTGGFGGVKEFVAQRSKPDALAIGYPGNDAICVGARGFYRVEIDVFGLAAHSGSSSQTGQNAVVKAAEIVAALAAQQLPKEADSDFAFGPKLTVTAINGGKSFAAVPDKCTITVDTRLTPSFTKESAAALIAETVAQIDSARVTAKATEIRAKESWPPYKLDRELPLLKALQEAAGKEYGSPLKLKVVGPSNIGNYLAGLGIPAICGFGVNYKNIHAANECIEIASIETTYRIYVNAVEKLLTVPSKAVDKV